MRLAVFFIGLVFLIAAIAASAFLPTLIVGCPTCGPATVGNLVGYVTNTSSANGIVGASVVLSVSGTQKYATSTVTQGYYKFGAITAGGYTITVSASGFQTFQGITGVSPGTTAFFNVQLSPLSNPGYSGGSGCTPTPSGAGCATPPPPPPPGITAPPPIPQPTQTYNATLPPPINQIPIIGGMPTIAFGFLLIGLVLVVGGVVLRRR